MDKHPYEGGGIPWMVYFIILLLLCGGLVFVGVR